MRAKRTGNHRARKPAASRTPWRLWAPGRLRAALAMASAAALAPPAVLCAPHPAYAAGIAVSVTKNVPEGTGGPTGRVVEVRLSEPAPQEINVNYTVGAGQALPDSDYLNVAPGTLTFAPGEDVKQITVPIVGDGVHEGAEDFMIHLSGGDGVVTTGLTTHFVLIDDDDPVPSIATVTDVSVSEDNYWQPVEFEATLSNPSAQDIWLDVLPQTRTATADQGGVGSQDFEIPHGMIRVPAGAVSVKFSVTVRGDNIHEKDETAGVAVAPPSHAVNVVGRAEGTLTLLNDDAAPRLTVGEPYASEGGGVALHGWLAGTAQEPINYTVHTELGDAEPTDFDAQGVPSFGVLNPGDSSLSLGTLQILDDTVDDDDETMYVVVTAPGMDQVRVPVRIADHADDRPPHVWVGPLTVPEGVGVAHVPVTLNFNNYPNTATSTEKSITVRAGTRDSSATAWTNDYTAVDTSVTIPPGAPSGGIPVSITDDQVVEPDEQFAVTVDSTDPYQGFDQREAPVTIQDDDATGPNAPKLSVTAPAEVSESSVAQVEFRLSGQLPWELRMQVSTHDSTVTTNDHQRAGGHDYYLPPYEVVIPAGQTYVTVPVHLHHDDVYEGPERLVVTLQQAEGAPPVPFAGSNRVEMTVVDDDPVPVFSLNREGRPEGSSAMLQVSADRFFERDMKFELSLAGESVDGRDPAEPSDFQGGPVTAVITGGQWSSTWVGVGPIMINEDAVDEDVETIKVVVRNLTVPSPDVVTAIDILDGWEDQPPAVRIEPVTVPEGVGTAYVPVKVDFAATGNNGATSTEQPIVVNAATHDFSASGWGNDFDTFQGPVTIPPGAPGAAVPVQIRDDTIAEPEEQFVLNIDAAGLPIPIFEPKALVTIQDDDPITGDGAPGPSGPFEPYEPRLSMAAPIEVAEGSLIGVESRLRLTQPLRHELRLGLAVYGITASTGEPWVGGNDFVAPHHEIVIPAGQTWVDFWVELRNDDVYEGPESLSVTVWQMDPQSAPPFDGPNRAEVTIVDDDPAPTVTFRGGSYVEGDGAAILARADRPFQPALSFEFQVAGAGVDGRNPAEPADFGGGPVTGVLRSEYPAGTWVGIATVDLTEDTVDEDVETIEVTARSLTLKAPDAVTAIEIEDGSEDRPPALTVGSATVSERDGAVRVPITTAFEPGNGATATERPIAVTYDVLPGSAGADDFGAPAAPNPLIIEPGATYASIPVPVSDDTSDEDDELFYLYARSVTPTETPIVANTGFVTVTDDDQTVADYTMPETVSVGEEAGSASVAVTLSAPAPADLDLTVEARDGTATEAGGKPGSDDYDAPPAALRIPKGARTATIRIPIKRDTVFEGDEKVLLTVAPAAGETDVAGTPRQSTLVIKNDDARPTITLAGATAAEGAELTVSATVKGVAQDDLKFEDLAVAAPATGDAAEATDFDLGGLTGVLPGGAASGSKVALGVIRATSDDVDEATEGLRLTVGGQSATYQITDDPADVAPTVSIGDASFPEAAPAAEVKVQLTWSGTTNATERSISVPWSTVNGSAVGGRDFTAARGTLTFPPGTETGVVRVPLLDDKQNETSQTFTIALGAPTPADVRAAKARGVVTVEDDDRAVAPTLSVPATILGAGTPSITGIAGAGAEVELLGALGPAGTAFRVLDTATANAEGAFTFQPYLAQGHRLVARADGLSSPIRTLQVQQEPTLTATSGVRGAATLTVTADPKIAGLPVTVQELVNGDWDTVATGRLSAAGTFTVTERGLRAGTHTYRATVGASPTRGVLAGQSANRSVRVR